MNRTRLTILGCLILLQLGACARPPGRVARDPGGYDAAARADAAAHHERIRGLLAAGEWTDAQRQADAFLAEYPGIEREPDVLLLGARAARQANDFRTAARWSRRLVETHPDSPRIGAAHLELAEIEAHRAEWTSAAFNYVSALDAQGVPEDRVAEVRAETRRILEEELGLPELEDLAQRVRADGVAASTLHYLVAQRRFAQEPVDDQELGPQLEDFLRRFPDSRFAPDVQSMLAEVRARSGYEPSPDLALQSPDRIGILCPLTGENANLGQAMYDGALLALEEHNRRTGSNHALVSMDTRGDGVRAVQAARDLIDREGALALVGGLLSSTTISIATLCEERGVPLISPTATQETISELGLYVFQTNLTKALETHLVARAAVDYLLKRRFAIIYPQTEEGTRAAEMFAAEVERAGAAVVAMEGLERGITDFGPVLRRVRSAGPEAIFAPLSASEMRLLAPQFTFYGLETQLLGPSSWNNSLLSREVGQYLDRAIFPSDIAQIPTQESNRFEELWRRRYPGAPSSPFALKTYFAVQQILEGMEQGIRTREGMQLYLAGTMGYAGAGERLGLEKLRVLVDGEVAPFPLEDFPPRMIGPTLDDFLDGGR